MKEIISSAVFAGAMFLGAGEAVAQEPTDTTTPETTTTLFTPDHGDQCFETGNPEWPTSCEAVPLDTTTSTTVVEVSSEIPVVSRPIRSEPLARTGSTETTAIAIGFSAIGVGALAKYGERAIYRRRSRQHLSRI